MDEAHTQHKQKTADELVLLADTVANHLGTNPDDIELQKLRSDSKKDIDAERESLRKHVKGMAKTGIDIFARRIQGVWEEWYPFADERTLDALSNLGFKANESSLVDFVKENWEKLDTKSLRGSKEEKQRHVFVKILERAVGAELEGNVAEIRQAIV